MQCQHFYGAFYHNYNIILTIRKRNIWFRNLFAEKHRIFFREAVFPYTGSLFFKFAILCSIAHCLQSAHKGVGRPKKKDLLPQANKTIFIFKTKKKQQRRIVAFKFVFAAETGSTAVLNSCCFSSRPKCGEKVRLRTSMAVYLSTKSGLACGADLVSSISSRVASLGREFECTQSVAHEID